MSVEAMAIALHHSRARGAAKLVLIGIANHDGDGGAWPSMGTLAAYANANVRNTQHAVDALEKLGEVSRKINGGGGRTTADHMRPNLYTFNLKCPPNCDGTTAHRLLCVVCGKTLPPPRRLLLHHLACPLSPATPPVTGDTRPPSQATPEPLNNPTQPPNSATHVLNRAQAHEEDGSADSHRPADAMDDLGADRCPRRPYSPHAYSRGGVCLDCGATAADTTPTLIGAHV